MKNKVVVRISLEKLKEYMDLPHEFEIEKIVVGPDNQLTDTFLVVVKHSSLPDVLEGNLPLTYNVEEIDLLKKL